MNENKFNRFNFNSDFFITLSLGAVYIYLSEILLINNALSVISKFILFILVECIFLLFGMIIALYDKNINKAIVLSIIILMPFFLFNRFQNIIEVLFSSSFRLRYILIMGLY